MYMGTRSEENLVRAPAEGAPSPGLQQIVDAYHHLTEEHRREGAHGSWRRRFERRLAALEAKFENLLAHTVPDPEDKARWRSSLFHEAAMPARTVERRYLRFKGKSEAGTCAEVWEDEGGAVLLLDGKPTRRSPGPEWTKDVTAEGLRMRVDGIVYEERFDAPEPAMEALAAHAADPTSTAPWAWAPELWAEGLIDQTFAITPRGRRLIGARRHGRG